MPVVVQMERYGDPGVLHAVHRDQAPARDGETVVRMRAAGVVAHDLAVRGGAWPVVMRWPYVPGFELIGEADGQPVVAMMQPLGGLHGDHDGSYGEVVVLPSEALVPIPGQLGVQGAAALGLPAVTAWHAVRALEAQAGMRVLVLGAARPEAWVAVALLRAAGCRVFAGAEGPRGVEIADATGPDKAVDTRWRSWFRELGTVHRVLELSGGAAFAQGLTLLKPGGRIVVSGPPGSPPMTVQASDLTRPITLTGWDPMCLDAAAIGSALAGLAASVDAGVLSLPPMREFPLAEASAAHVAAASGTAGRVVLRP